MNEGDGVTLTGSFIDPAGADTNTLNWSVVTSNGQSIPGGTGPTFTFSPGDAGTYTVTFTVSDQNGRTASATVQVTSVAVGPVLTAPARHFPRSRASTRSSTWARSPCRASVLSR